ncbi:SWIM zinc finger family protein [Catenulispora yoronensis]|uniref:SWIM zinc finger family protein n=1 Tax=Catenulispora yoronensis TaxID=450799 RepID=A0ABP5G3J5_9ACTN
MSDVALPQVTASVLADAVELLSPRLRKRLDDTLAKAATWPITADEAAGTVTATVDEDTRVVLTPRNGAIQTPEDAVCSCLLAPACLHRAAILGLAPLTNEEDAVEAATAEEPEATEKSTATEESAAADQPPASLSPDQLTAAEGLRAAAEELIDVGLAGAGLATEATLRRAVHTARATGLYLPAAIGNRVAAQLRAYRTQAQDHSLASYADELRTLMQTIRTLSTSTDSATLDALRGTVRRRHEHQGGLRLSGVFSEPVIASSGMAGVVTCAVDPAGTLWSVPAVTPGGPTQVENAYHGGVGLGGAALSHEELVREGLIVSGASASADGSLSHGAGVRAVRASGASWWEGPVAARFAVPLAEQLERALTSRDARIGDDMVFVEATILPKDGNASTAPGTKPGDVPITLGERIAVLRSASDHPALAYVANLNILSQAPGLRVRLIARPDPARPGVLLPIACSPDSSPTAHRHLHLPEAWHDRICLGIDRMHDSMILPAAPATAAAPDAIASPMATGIPDATRSIPLHHLRTAVERTAAGGRRAARLASSHTDARHLTSAGMPHAAAVLQHLTTAASAPNRDAYGRVLPQATTTFAEAWLAAALFENMAAAQLAVAAWGLPTD